MEPSSVGVSLTMFPESSTIEKYFQCIASNLWPCQDLWDLDKVRFLSRCLQDDFGTVAWHAGATSWAAGSFYLLQVSYGPTLHGFLARRPCWLFLCLRGRLITSWDGMLLFPLYLASWFLHLPTSCKTWLWKTRVENCSVFHVLSQRDFSPCILVEIVGDYL